MWTLSGSRCATLVPAMLFLFVPAAFAQVNGGGIKPRLMEISPHIAQAERPAFRLSAESTVAVPARPGSSVASAQQPRTDYRSSDLSLEGTLGYVVAGDESSLELMAEKVANNRSGGTSGTIRLSLWATTIRPVFGTSVESGYRLGYYQFASTLPAGYYYGDVDRFVSYSRPANGTYYITMFLEEYRSTNDPFRNEGYTYSDLFVFSGQVTFGPASTAAVIVDHAMTSGIDSNLLAVNRLGSFSAGDAVAISWVKLNPFLGPHTLRWTFYSPDGSLYSDTGTSVQTGVSGYAYYGYYAGINLAGAAAASRPGIWHVNFILDGSVALTETFTLVAVVSNHCTADAATLCLLGGRFKVTLAVSDPRVSGAGAANATAQGDWGYFDVPAATGSRDKPVIFVKLIDGRPVNQRYWVFYGGLTDLQYTFTVTDTQTGAAKSYTKATGTYDGRADTNAFPGN
ncbi:MAG: hypothetical protein JWO56_1017 [Acidobacteria bacterium]|nr:hypothetical protein [Acidobacteriota bacterium]